jgi:hypothetical protein
MSSSGISAHIMRVPNFLPRLQSIVSVAPKRPEPAEYARNALPPQFAEIHVDFSSAPPRANGGAEKTALVRKPISRSRPVSEGRTVSTNPFGT